MQYSGFSDGQMIEILPGFFAVDLLEYLYISSIAGGFATGQKTPRGWGGVIHRRGTFSVWAACLIVQHFSTHHSGNLMSSLHLDISNMIFHMTIPKLLVNWRQNCGKRRVSFQPLWQEVLLSFQIFPDLSIASSLTVTAVSRNCKTLGQELSCPHCKLPFSVPT